MSAPLKQYLGDSVYADFDGYHIILTTENGYGASNTIALEPAVMTALEDYKVWSRKQAEAIAAARAKEGT